MIPVKVHLEGQSLPIYYDEATNTYTKDGLFCVLLPSGEVHKYPLTNIFRVTEGYGPRLTTRSATDDRD